MLVGDIESMFDLYGVDVCDDNTFAKEAKDSDNPKTESTIGQFLRMIAKKLMVFVGHIKDKNTWLGWAANAAWSMAKTIANALVFHPRILRFILYLIVQRKKAICRSMGSFLVKNGWVDPSWLTQTKTEDKNTYIMEVIKTLRDGVGLLEWRRYMGDVLDSPAVQRVTSQAGSMAAGVVGASITFVALPALGSIGLPASIGLGVSSVAVAGTTLVIDLLVSVATDAAKYQWEFDVYKTDVVQSAIFLLSILDVRGCLQYDQEDMPNKKEKQTTPALKVTFPRLEERNITPSQLEPYQTSSVVEEARDATQNEYERIRGRQRYDPRQSDAAIQERIKNRNVPNITPVPRTIRNNLSRVTNVPPIPEEVPREEAFVRSPGTFDNLGQNGTPFESR